MTRTEGLASRLAPSAGGGFLDLGLEVLQHRLHRAHDERQADEGQREHDARAA